MSSSSINESGREFHNLIVEGRKEFKYVSVLAKGYTIYGRIVCEFGPVWSGPYREIMDPA